METSWSAANAVHSRAGSCGGSAPSRPKRNDFKVLEHLGEGSVGAVSKVQHNTSGKIYAMKTIQKKRILAHDLGAQILSEVKTQLVIKHPNLLRCMDYFEDANTVSLVLEFADGGDLHRLIKERGRLDEPDAAHIFVQVANGVQYLHDTGMVHRDLKPENILLTGDLVAKVADFGWCAKSATRTTFCGTLCMLAPEMVTGEPYDWRVDIWAIGVLLYEMLAGASPFDNGGGIMAVCDNIVRRGLDGTLLEKTPPATHSLLKGLLQRQASRRMLLPEALAHSWTATQHKLRVAAHPEPAEEDHFHSQLSACPFADCPAAPSSNREVMESKNSPKKDWDLPPTDALLVEKLPSPRSRRLSRASSSTAMHQSAVDPVNGHASEVSRPKHEISARSSYLMSLQVVDPLTSRMSSSTAAAVDANKVCDQQNPDIISNGGALSSNRSKDKLIPLTRVDLLDSNLPGKQLEKNIKPLDNSSAPAVDVTLGGPWQPPKTQLEILGNAVNVGDNSSSSSGFVGHAVRNHVVPVAAPFASPSYPGDTGYLLQKQETPPASISEQMPPTCDRIPKVCHTKPLAKAPAKQKSAARPSQRQASKEFVYGAEEHEAPYQGNAQPQTQDDKGSFFNQNWLGPALRFVGAAQHEKGSRSAGITAQEVQPAAVPRQQSDLQQQLINLGFDAQQAADAVKRTSSVEAAVEWIVSHGNGGT